MLIVEVEEYPRVWPISRFCGGSLVHNSLRWRQFGSVFARRSDIWVRFFRSILPEIKASHSIFEMRIGNKMLRKFLEFLSFILWSIFDSFGSNYFYLAITLFPNPFVLFISQRNRQQVNTQRFDWNSEASCRLKNWKRVLRCLIATWKAQGSCFFMVLWWMTWHGLLTVLVS